MTHRLSPAISHFEKHTTFTSAVDSQSLILPPFHQDGDRGHRTRELFRNRGRYFFFLLSFTALLLMSSLESSSQENNSQVKKLAGSHSRLSRCPQGYGPLQCEPSWNGTNHGEQRMVKIFSSGFQANVGWTPALKDNLLYKSQLILKINEAPFFRLLRMD